MKKLNQVTMADRRKFLMLGTAAAGVASLGISMPAYAQRAKVFRYGHNLPTDTLYHRAVVVLADEVAKLSSGRLKIDIYPTSQLGSVAEMLSAVKVGSLNMCEAVPAWYSNFMKPIDAFTLPYIVSSTDKLHSALDGKLGDAVDTMAQGAGFKILGYHLIGARHILNRVRPVNVPDDCKGLKLRVINSQVYIQTFQTLGAVPVAMDAAEIYLALQQNVVDGFEVALPDVLAFKWNEVVKYCSLDAHGTDFILIAMNKGQWDGLTPDDQGIFKQAMKASADFQWKAQPESIDQALAKLRTLIAVNDITPENKQKFVQATRPVYAKFQDSIGKDFLDLCVQQLS